jgi:hypothetical protein
MWKESLTRGNSPEPLIISFDPYSPKVRLILQRDEGDISNSKSWLIWDWQGRLKVKLACTGLSWEVLISGSKDFG